MKTKLRTGITVGAVLAVIAVTVFSFCVINYGWWLAEIPAADAKLINLGYLEGTKLYIISATARYGNYKGQDCFIINVTIRSDYTHQNPAPGQGTDLLERAFFDVTATLHHNNATLYAKAESYGETHPIGIYPPYDLLHGETDWFEINMATLNRNIDSYSIVLRAISNDVMP